MSKGVVILLILIVVNSQQASQSTSTPVTAPEGEALQNISNVGRATKIPFDVPSHNKPYKNSSFSENLPEKEPTASSPSIQSGQRKEESQEGNEGSLLKQSNNIQIDEQQEKITEYKKTEQTLSSSEGLQRSDGTEETPKVKKQEVQNSKEKEKVLHQNDQQAVKKIQNSQKVQQSAVQSKTVSPEGQADKDRSHQPSKQQIKKNLEQAKNSMVHEHNQVQQKSQSKQSKYRSKQQQKSQPNQQEEVKKDVDTVNPPTKQKSESHQLSSESSKNDNFINKDKKLKPAGEEQETIAIIPAQNKKNQENKTTEKITTTSSEKENQHKQSDKIIEKDDQEGLEYTVPLKSVQSSPKESSQPTASSENAAKDRLSLPEDKQQTANQKQQHQQITEKTKKEDEIAVKVQKSDISASSETAQNKPSKELKQQTVIDEPGKEELKNKEQSIKIVPLNPSETETIAIQQTQKKKEKIQETSGPKLAEVSKIQNDKLAKRQDSPHQASQSQQKIQKEIGANQTFTRLRSHQASDPQPSANKQIKPSEAIPKQKQIDQLIQQIKNPKAQLGQATRNQIIKYLQAEKKVQKSADPSEQEIIKQVEEELDHQKQKIENSNEENSEEDNQKKFLNSQQMDSTTIVVIIVLTFLISIPVIREIRRTEEREETDSKRKSSIGQGKMDADKPQEIAEQNEISNQSGFQIAERLDEEFN